MSLPDPSAVSDLRTLAAELTKLRTRAARGSSRRSVSIADLARTLGPHMSRSTLHSYVSGRTLPPAEILDRIVIALGAGPDEQAAWSEAWDRVYDNRQPHPPRTAPPMSAEEVLATLHERVASQRSKPLDVVTVSAQNMDAVYRVSAIAADYESQISEPTLGCGGSGANTAYALARLDHRVSVVGIVGADAYGRQLRADLESVGADTSMLVTAEASAGSSGHTLVFTDREGRRLIYVNPGVNEKLVETLTQNEGIDSVIALVNDARVIHLSSFTGFRERQLQEELVERLDPNVILSLNPGAIYAGLGANRIAKLLSRANVIFMYEQQLERLLEHSSSRSRYGNARISDSLAALFEWRGQRGSDQPLVLVIKRPADLHRGTRDAYLSVAYGVTDMTDLGGPDVRPVQRDVLDSTGAGDSLAAGFLSAILTGRTPRECENLAYIMALSASMGLGARAALPTRNELVDCWRTHLPDVPTPRWLTKGLPA